MAYEKIFNPSQQDIQDISKIFSIEHIGNSRIDGYPMFKTKYTNYNDLNELKEFFSLQLIPLLEDHIAGFMATGSTINMMPGFPAGQKDFILLKISGLKKDYKQFVRSEKLKKIEIHFQDEISGS